MRNTSISQYSIGKSGLPWLLLAVGVILLDRMSKTWVLSHLSFYEPLTILPILDFTLSFNKGAAFSFLNAASGWQNISLGSVACTVSVWVLIWLYRLSINAWFLNTTLCLILGGALGNVWDRILYGHVVDFISFHWNNWYFAIFNLADSAICLGAFLMFIHLIKQK